MTTRHVLDRALALILLPLVLTLIACVFVLVYPFQRGPFLYRSERMKSPTEAFTLYKIRSMHPPSPFDGERILGGDQSDRITRIGRILRKTRLDELPQIFNILRGDIGFVGPRPPLRKYVEAYPDIYRKVLETRPGVTGLATVLVCAREERLLSQSSSPEETDLIYRKSCIRAKARLDIFYAENKSAGLLAFVIFATLFRRQPRSLRVLRSLPELPALPTGVATRTRAPAS